MANRKLGPVEGDVCWFCKMGADDESWMGLGLLKSTKEPVFEGRHILYHECCAVYSCGAEGTPLTGMSDDNVLKWYRHGEKAAGIGLKCQLCGKRGATTGCFYGPCQQFYHFPCARARAYQGYLAFSLDGKRLACLEHTPLLPLPHEASFMGMWMEGVGSWNGMLMEQAREDWLPAYQAHQAHFIQRWEPLLNMTPVADLRAMQQMSKAPRKGVRARGSKGTEDPDYRIKGAGGGAGGGKARKTTSQQQPRRSTATASSDGGGAAAAAAAAAGRPSTSSGATKKSRQGKRQHKGSGQQLQPQPALQYQQQGWLGVSGDVAAAAEWGAGYGGAAAGHGYGAAAAAAAAGHPTTTSGKSRSSFLEDAASGELFSPTSARSRQVQYPGQLPSDHHQHQQDEMMAAGNGLDQQYHQLQQQQQTSWHDTSGGGGAAAGGGAGAGSSMGGGQAGDDSGKEALLDLLRAAGGDNLQEQPVNSAGNASAPAAAPAKPSLSCQLLLAAAGFDTFASPEDEEPVPVPAGWPDQRASSAGRYLNHQPDWGAGQQRHLQQQQQPSSMLAAAPAGAHGPQQDALAAAAAGEAGSLGQGPAGRTSAAAAAAGGGVDSRVALGRSVSGASSADSAPNEGHQQPGQLLCHSNTGNEQQQHQEPQQPPKQEQQVPQPQGAAVPAQAGADEMLQKIAAAMKAVTEAEGPEQAEALKTAAAMIAAAAAAQGGSARPAGAAAMSSDGGAGVASATAAGATDVPAASGQQQQQAAGGAGEAGPPADQLAGVLHGVEGPQGSAAAHTDSVKHEPLQELQHEVMDLLRTQFGAQ